MGAYWFGAMSLGARILENTFQERLELVIKQPALYTGVRLPERSSIDRQAEMLVFWQKAVTQSN